MRRRRWRAALGDRRLVALLAATIAVSLALLATPLSGRAWLLLVWGVLVYLVAAAVWASGTPVQTAPEQPASRRVVGGVETPRSVTSLREATEEALRRLNNPAALGECALVGHLPWTLKNPAGRDGDLSRPSHQALRTVLVEAINRLKPVGGAGPGGQTLHHAILHDEYVLGHSTAQIMIRYSISESTFHRHRRDAIRAVARDLAAQEEALARTRT